MKRGGDVDAALRSLLRRHALPDALTPRLGAVLEALSAEPDPHTTVHDPRAAVDRHVADSLEALRVEAVRGARALADIGAGAGFPGVVLAVALPEATVDLIESQARKCAVAGRLAAAAGASNVTVRCVRAEDWAGGAGRDRYDVVTARAVAPLSTLVEYAAPLLRTGGTLVAWKAALDPREDADGAAAAARLRMEPAPPLAATPWPGARSLSLHLYRKVGSTPPGYPRRPGMAAKRPIRAEHERS